MRSVSFWLAIGMLGAVSSAAAAPAATIYIRNCTTSSPQISVSGSSTCTVDPLNPPKVYTVPACGAQAIVRASDCAVSGGEALCYTSMGVTCYKTWYGAMIASGGIDLQNQNTISSAKRNNDEETWGQYCDCPIDGVTWP